MDNMMKRNENFKEFLQALACVVIYAGIGVMLAWRG